MKSGPISIDKQYKEDFLEGRVTPTNRGVSTDKDSLNRSLILEQTGKYFFTWGEIVERVAGSFILWDIHLSSLAKQDYGEIELFEIQSRAIIELRALYPQYAEKQTILAAGLHDSWCVYPGSDESLFTVAASLTCNKEAREWVYSNLIEAFLPNITRNLG